MSNKYINYLATTLPYNYITITTRLPFLTLDIWSNTVAVADLVQLWTNAQGAAGGGARSDLN